MSSHHERLARLRSFHERDPANLKLAFELFDTALAAGDSALAESLVDGWRTSCPQEPGARFRSATLAIARGGFRSAAEQLATLAAEGHDALALRHNWALAQLCAGDAAAALATLQPVLDRWQEHPPILVLCARVHHNLGARETAIGLLRQLLGSTTPTAEALGLLALLEQELGRSADARGLAQAALALEPDQLEAMLALGGAALDAQQSADAERALAHATARHPASGRAWSALAQAHMLGTDFASAERALTTAVERMPEHAGTWLLLAWCRIQRGARAEARAAALAAYERDHGSAETQGTLAVIAALDGDVAAAEQALRRAHQLAPGGGSPTAQVAEALLLERAGASADARATFEALLDRPTGSGGEPLRNALARALAGLRGPASGG